MQSNNHAKDLRHQVKATEVGKKKRRSSHQSPFDCGIDPKELAKRPRMFQIDVRIRKMSQGSNAMDCPDNKCNYRHRDSRKPQR
jgi:hypothetical protein